MADDTSAVLQEQVIYSVYVRAHTEEGTFLSIIPDLDRIRALGADWIWFLPIHPIGEKGKKGSLGCPYANRDYRTTNPVYGSMEEFRFLCDEIHRRGMKVMIDVVYNHTSPDAVLLGEHPDFYYRDAAGKLGNKIGDWADVIDLDYRSRALWDYQIESLRFWASIVDGFRCDVASFVPLDFWRAARSAVAEVNPGCVWLAESVHLSFGNFARREGFTSARDSEAFDAFDIEYQYDVWESFERFLAGKGLLHEWTEQLNFRAAELPGGALPRELQQAALPRKPRPAAHRLARHRRAGARELYRDALPAQGHDAALCRAGVFLHSPAQSLRARGVPPLRARHQRAPCPPCGDQKGARGQGDPLYRDGRRQARDRRDGALRPRQPYGRRLLAARRERSRRRRRAGRRV